MDAGRTVDMGRGERAMDDYVEYTEAIKGGQHLM
jgi:hypothetical protein